MGKRITVQKRGKGSTSYRTPGHRFKGAIRNIGTHEGQIKGKVLDLIGCRGHSAPLMIAQYEEGYYLVPAPEGVKVNDEIISGEKTSMKPGDVMALKDIPEGTSIYNIELNPGDGGKFVRSSGTTAKVISKTGTNVIIKLPSKKEKSFNEKCRACIGIVAGGGRKEKPILKAGNAYKARGARNKLYPIVSPNCMASVAHPYGNTRSLRKSKTRPVSRNAPPGRKVGMVAARRTGRRKK